MSNEKADWWVRLFVLLGLIALTFLSLKAGNLSSFSLSKTYSVYAKFDNIGGLKARAPIKSAGVVVGRVSNIDLDTKSFQAVVTLDIQEGVNFPADSSAKILTSGLLGEQYIGLEPGGDDKNLKTGDTVHYTQSAIVLENLISQFLFNFADKQGSSSAAPDSSAGSKAER